ncbi:hypothetical protein DPB93_19845 [Salmonella enterica subsp. salamae]|nr:hypothetical protein [Salmonella enterica subsp. salamae]
MILLNGLSMAAIKRLNANVQGAILIGANMSDATLKCTTMMIPK